MAVKAFRSEALIGARQQAMQIIEAYKRRSTKEPVIEGKQPEPRKGRKGHREQWATTR